MDKIFINYRREDSEGFARGLFQSLVHQFGKNKVFINVEAIAPGTDFVEAIDKSLADCGALLVLIGKNWADCKDSAGVRRLEKGNDFVRTEVVKAIEHNVRIIPVLVKGAPMPEGEDLPESLKFLTHIQALKLRHERWDSDMEHLASNLEKILALKRLDKYASSPPAPIPPTPEKTSKTPVVIGAGQKLMSNIFISYNRMSEAVARTLVNDIEALGHTVWFDQELSGGQTWWDQILVKIRDCDIFVFVLNPEALNSRACKLEFGYANDLGKPIIPVLVSGEISTNLLPPALSQIQFVDYRKKDRDAAFRLVRAIATIPPLEPPPVPLPTPPEAPISYLANLTEQVETTCTLSYEEQCALVVDLKRSLRGLSTTGDTRTLLERLRKRHDLFATIGEEIDELIGTAKKTSSTPPSVSKTKLSSPERDHNKVRPTKLSERNRMEKEKLQRTSTQSIPIGNDLNFLSWRWITLLAILFCSGLIFYGALLSIQFGGEAIEGISMYGVGLIFSESCLFLYFGILLMIAGLFGLFFVIKKKYHSITPLKSKIQSKAEPDNTAGSKKSHG